jgi:hypothetical protein
MDPYRRLYFKKFLRGGRDGPIKSGTIALKRLSPSLGEWSYWSVGCM